MKLNRSQRQGVAIAVAIVAIGLVDVVVRAWGGWGVVLLLLCPFLVVAAVRGNAQGREKVAGRARCEFCGSRLKLAADKHGYRDTCRKCGRTQTWTRKQRTQGA